MHSILFEQYAYLQKMARAGKTFNYNILIKKWLVMALSVLFTKWNSHMTVKMLQSRKCYKIKDLRYYIKLVLFLILQVNFINRIESWKLWEWWAIPMFVVWRHIFTLKVMEGRWVYTNSNKQSAKLIKSTSFFFLFFPPNLRWLCLLLCSQNDSRKMMFILI